MSVLLERLQEIADAADRRAMPAVYAAVSVSTEGTRAWLRGRALPFLDPDAPPPSLADVDHTADHVIAQSQARAAAIGAFAGFGGLLSLPPEVGAWVVASLRMAQRLAVVYGLDPHTDRGRAALARALSAGFEVDLQERGLVELRVSDLAGTFRPERPDVRKVGADLTRRVVSRTLRLATGRVGRLVPLISSPVSAADNHEQAARIGARMKDVFRRLADAPLPRDRRIHEAVEVVGDP